MERVYWWYWSSWYSVPRGAPRNVVGWLFPNELTQNSGHWHQVLMSNNESNTTAYKQKFFNFTWKNQPSPGLTCKFPSLCNKKRSPQNEASTLSHTDLNTTHVLTKWGPVTVIKCFQSEYRCQQINLSHWFLQLKYLNSKTKLLIILGIYQKHQDQFEY